jgi:hypothetical protein
MFGLRITKQLLCYLQGSSKLASPFLHQWFCRDHVEGGDEKLAATRVRETQGEARAARGRKLPSFRYPAKCLNG